MNTKILENFGLTNNESKIYLALLELNSTTANKISERTGIHRRTIYDILEILIEKGLVSFVIESNKKYYQAESPQRFLDILNIQTQEFEKILPELLIKQKLNKESQEATIYRGKKGAKNVYDLMLQTKKTIYVFGSSGRFKEILGEIYYKKWCNKFVENKCKMKIILSKALKETMLGNAEVRYLPGEFVLPSSTAIFDNKLFITLFSEQLICILIKSEA